LSKTCLTLFRKSLALFFKKGQGQKGVKKGKLLPFLLLLLLLLMLLLLLGMGLEAHQSAYTE
jgi:hypothetical protein